MANTLESADVSFERGDGESRPTGRRREDRVVGVSRSTRRALEAATVAAQSDLPVLVTGPFGCGKQLFARAIHLWGKRAGGPVRVLACDSVPEPLQLREVFGCGANVHSMLPLAYDGLLASAAGGTAVLAQVDHLRPDVRRGLLAAIAERSFEREGEGARTPLRARVILTAERADGEVSLGDLPHHAIQVEPLAERPEDVLPLAAHFLRAFAQDEGVEPGGFTAEARTALLAETWPGNVADLRERIRHAVRIAGSRALSPEVLLLAGDGADIPSFKEAKRAFETRYVEGLLRRCSGNISRAARLAKKDRKDFYDVIRRTGVDPTQFRS